MLLSSISDINSSGADKKAAYSNVLALNVLTDDGANRLHLFMCCNDQVKSKLNHLLRYIFLIYQEIYWVGCRASLNAH